MVRKSNTQGIIRYFLDYPTNMLYFFSNYYKNFIVMGDFKNRTVLLKTLF